MASPLRLLIFAALGAVAPGVAGCDPGGTKADQRPDGRASGDDDGGDADVDLDGDGWPSLEDCDDLDARVHPGAAEDCDRLDNDCDGVVDERGRQPWYLDADGDGYGR